MVLITHILLVVWVSFAQEWGILYLILLDILYFRGHVLLGFLSWMMDQTASDLITRILWKMIKVLSPIIRTIGACSDLILLIILDLWIFIIEPFCIFCHILGNELIRIIILIGPRLRALGIISGWSCKRPYRPHLNEVSLIRIILALQILVCIKISITFILHVNQFII